jgi:hypothetical protein
MPQQKLPPWKQRHVAPQKRTPREPNLGQRKIFRGQGAMRFWQLTCFAAAFAASPLCVTVLAKIPTDQSNSAAEVAVTEQPPSFSILSATPATFSQRFSVLLQEEESVVDNVNEKEARLEQEDFPFRDRSAGATSPKPHSSYLGSRPGRSPPQRQ